MEDSEGVGGTSRGQALLHDHLQSSQIHRWILRGLCGVMDRHGIDTFGGKCGNCWEDGGRASAQSL